jgi:integrase
MGKKRSSFRVGRVRAYLRGRVWYLSYWEQGQRRQPRVGPDRDPARVLAAEINGQLEAGAPSALGFEAITFAALRQRWLDHHEHVRRSSLNTIRRYRSATSHLLEFTAHVRPLKKASELQPVHVEEFIRFLRSRKVAPNGHRKARKRTLRDSGVKYVLETCSSLMNYAQRQRHLPPYAENPFRVIEINRIPVEDAKPVVALTNDEQVALLEHCDDWQFPVFLTLLLTGLRPGELVHLLLPADLDLVEGWLRVRNKPRLGWQIKTRNERDVPLLPILRDVLRQVAGERQSGPLFRQRRCFCGFEPPLGDFSLRQLELEVARRNEAAAANLEDSSQPRVQQQAVAQTIWRDLGALKEDGLRKEFMALTRAIGLEDVTAPKTLRHTFATCLQDGNVDPLIRNELMGHAPMASTLAGGLGMTTVYTHTRPETKWRQFEAALCDLPVMGMSLRSFAESRILPSMAWSPGIVVVNTHNPRAKPVSFPTPIPAALRARWSY